MVYVISDIHGNMRRFLSVLKQIDLQPSDTLYVLGDVIDRHPDGIRILRKLMAMPNAKMLLGNHEYMMLRALGEPYDPADREQPYDLEQCLRLWYRNGGGVTHHYWKHIRKSVRAEICGYLKSLPLNIDITVNNAAYKLVHGAPAEQYELYGEQFRNRTHFAVWKRLQDEDPSPLGCTMIFGHTTTRHYQEHFPMCIYHGQGSSASTAEVDFRKPRTPMIHPPAVSPACGWMICRYFILKSLGYIERTAARAVPTDRMRRSSVARLQCVPYRAPYY